MQALQKFDLVVRSAILRSEKPNKPIDAQPSTNPNQMHRVIGYLPDGQRVVVAKREGRAGMDFNKLMGGRTYALAADGFSPVFEKDANKQRTRVQKTEDGLPLYSSQGFYLLSSKDYPALDISECYARIFDKGEKVALLSDAQLAARQTTVLHDRLELEMLEGVFAALLGDEHNLVARFDTQANQRRKRGIARAIEEAEDEGETYGGAQWRPLAASHKDGNPFVAFAFRCAAGNFTGHILRERTALDDGRMRTRWFDPETALEHFRASPAGRALAAALDAGEAVRVGFVQGHVMRTSVSFRRKVQNINEAAAAAPQGARFGDAVFVLGAQKGWLRAIVSLMHSLHPGFPAQDYEAHHYVCAPRQAEVGMNRTGTKTWSAPQPIAYNLPATLLETGKPSAAQRSTARPAAHPASMQRVPEAA